jgi:hypothetical protein
MKKEHTDTTFVTTKFCFSILLTRWTNNYPKEECAKFGYKSNMKVYIYI